MSARSRARKGKKSRKARGLSGDPAATSPSNTKPTGMHWMTRGGPSSASALRLPRAAAFFAPTGWRSPLFHPYELENAGIVGGSDYLARLNAPTPWSQRVTPLSKQFRARRRNDRGLAGISGRADTWPRCRSRRRTSIPPRRARACADSTASPRCACWRPTRRKPRSRRARSACAAPTASFGGLVLIEALDEAPRGTRSRAEGRVRVRHRGDRRSAALFSLLRVT